jgi:hypothetical protein
MIASVSLVMRGDEGARAVLVEIAGRQADGGGEHLLAQTLHHRLGDAVEAQGLQVEAGRRQHLQPQITGGKGGDDAHSSRRGAR